MQNRNVGIDVARAVALVGMMIAHLTYLDGVGVQVFYGFPAALFAFISGVSMGYMRSRPAQLIVRGLCLIALHFALAPLTGEVFVVLGTIGLCMALLAWGHRAGVRPYSCGWPACWPSDRRCWPQPRRC